LTCADGTEINFVINQKRNQIIRVNKAVKHDVREWPLVFRKCPVLPKTVENNFTYNVQVLLPILVQNTAKILASVNIKHPMHSFYRPLKSRVFK